MVISLGGGVNQVGVISLNGIVSADAARTGGLALDDAIICLCAQALWFDHRATHCRQLKIHIGAAIPQDEQLSLEVQGVDQVSSLPRPVVLTTDDIVEALQESTAGCGKTGEKSAGKDAAGVDLRHH